MAYKVGRKAEDGTVDYIKSKLTGKPLEIPTRATAEAYLLRKGYTQDEIDNDLVFEGEDTPVNREDYVEEPPVHKKKHKKKGHRYNDKDTFGNDYNFKG